MTETMTMDPRVSMDDAISALKREYYTDVNDLADEIRQAIVDGEIEDRDGLYERIHETVDGNSWVIWTRNAQTVLLVSDNDGAYIDDYGTDGVVKDGAINWSVLAYGAMERDLYQALDQAGVDVNGDTPAEMLRKDEDDEDDEDVEDGDDA